MKKAMLKTPIALFTYNRPDHVQLALKALARCDRLNECLLYIFCDGPKTSAQVEAVAASRQVVRKWASQLEAKVIDRSENLGLARSIVSGVTDLCQQYGRVIVVEDDFVVSPDFLHYMLEALNRYQDVPEVYQISGYMFPVEHPQSPDAFFLPLTTTRGWATWARAWRIFDWQATGFEENMANSQTRKRFDLDDSYPYYTMLRQKLAGAVDSWGILWWYAIFNVGGLVLHPRRSLVWVGGFDGSGTHWGKTPDFWQHGRESFGSKHLSQPLVFPEEIVVDEAAFSKIKELFQTRTWSFHHQSLFTRIKRRIRHYF